MVAAPVVSSQVQAIVQHIFAVRCISRKTQQQLMSCLLNQTQLPPQDYACVQQVFDGLQRGLLRVVD